MNIAQNQKQIAWGDCPWIIQYIYGRGMYFAQIP